MKKIFIPIIAIFLLAVGFVGWRASTYSAGTPPPYTNPDVDEPGLTACAKTTANQIYIMRNAWQNNLSSMMDQEKPASDMVDEGFESLRTYRCWLDYLCEAVLFSASADPSIGDRPLTEAEIEQVPGCASPDGLQIPDTKIQYIPACRASKDKTIEGAQGNYAECRKQVERDFAGDGDPRTSTAFIALKKTLKSNSANQEIRPLREKFESIVLKLNAMEGHMNYLKEQVERLDGSLPCYAKKCD